MFTADFSSVSEQVFSTKHVSLNALKDFDKEEFNRPQENLDKKDRADYNAGTISDKNKKPEPFGTGLEVGIDPMHCGKSMVSTPAISVKQGVVMSRPFMQIYNDLLDHPVIDGLSDKWHRIFIRILKKFVYADTIKHDHGKEIHLKRGQYMCDIRTLADEFGLKKSTLDDFIRKLRKHEIIGQNSGHIKTVITLSEYYIVKKTGQDSGQEPDKIRTEKNIYIDKHSSSSDVDEPKKPKKVLTPKATPSKPAKPAKPQPTAEELELKNQRKAVIDIAHKHGFPLAPSEIYKHIKQFSVEAVKVVVNLFVNGEYENTKEEHLKGAIYRRIETEHAYLEDFKYNGRDPDAA